LIDFGNAFTHPNNRKPFKSRYLRHFVYELANPLFYKDYNVYSQTPIMDLYALAFVYLALIDIEHYGNYMEYMRKKFEAKQPNDYINDNKAPVNFEFPQKHFPRPKDTLSQYLFDLFSIFLEFGNPKNLSKGMQSIRYLEKFKTEQFDPLIRDIQELVGFDDKPLDGDILHDLIKETKTVRL
jgi:hypothetical protein